MLLVVSVLHTYVVLFILGPRCVLPDAKGVLRLRSKIRGKQASGGSALSREEPDGSSISAIGRLRGSSTATLTVSVLHS